MTWQRILQYYSITYYTEVAAIVAAMLFLVLGLIYYKKMVGLKLLLPYSFFSFSQSLFGMYLALSEPNEKVYENKIFESVNIFLLIEFLIFFTILSKVIRSGPMRKLMLASSALFLAFVGYSWGYLGTISKSPQMIEDLEAFLLIIPCLHYYYNLVRNQPREPFYHAPTFWIITGICFYFSCTAPLFLFFDYLWNYQPSLFSDIYPINHIAYTVLFVCFIIGAVYQIRHYRLGHLKSSGQREILINSKKKPVNTAD